MTELSNVRYYLGLFASGIMILLGAVHSLVGWREFRRTTGVSDLPPPVLQGLAVPWHFTGLSMVAFGCVAAYALYEARRGGGSLTPAVIIGAAYVLFAVLCMALIKVDATFLMFLLPGALLLAAALL